ncbi:hypothetical protein [Labrys neptuniae]
MMEAMVGLVVAGVPAAAVGAPESFREEVVSLLRRHRPALKFTLPGDDPESVHVKVGEDTKQVYLGNLQRQLGTARGGGPGESNPCFLRWYPGRPARR